MGLFKVRTPVSIGVDIGSSAVKLLQLSRTRHGYRIEHHAIEPLPEGAVAGKRIVQAGVVAEALQRACAGCGHGCAAAAVAGSAAISRVVSLPAAWVGDDLERQVQVEADAYIPYPLDDVSLDFQVLGPTLGDPTHNDVLLVAARIEDVDERAAVLEQAGLVPAVVDVESFALANAFWLDAGLVSAASTASVAVVDVGARLTTLTVMDRHHVVYSREQAFGGAPLPERGVSGHGPSGTGDGYPGTGRVMPEDEDARRVFTGELAVQVGQLLHYFSAGGGGAVSRIILTGGGSSVAGVAGAIEAQCGVACAPSRIPATVPLAPHIQGLAWARHAPRMMLATGLALRVCGGGA